MKTTSYNSCIPSLSRAEGCRRRECKYGKRSYHSCIRNIYIIILQKWHDIILECWVTILVHERDCVKPSILTWIYCSFPDWAPYTVVVLLNTTSHSASSWNTTMVTILVAILVSRHQQVFEATIFVFYWIKLKIDCCWPKHLYDQMHEKITNPMV